jgi:hypothetical protein
MKLKLIFLGLFLFCLIENVLAFSSTVYIPEKYTNVEAGERVYFEVEIKYPENSIRKDLRLEYNVFDENNQLIVKSNTLKAIETQFSFIDFLVIPENADRGRYTLDVKITDYKDLDKSVSATFNVTASLYNQFKMYFYVLIGAIVFIGILVGINIYLSFRKKN